MPYSITQRVVVSDEVFGIDKMGELIDNNAALWDSFAVEHDPVTGRHRVKKVAKSVGVVLWDSAKESYSYAPWSRGFAGEPKMLEVGIVLLRLAYFAPYPIIQAQALPDDGAIWHANPIKYVTLPTGTTNYSLLGQNTDHVIICLANATTSVPQQANCSFGVVAHAAWS